MSSTQHRTMSTKEKLLGIVDDIEMIVKELLESSILSPKAEKLSPSDQSNLIHLLMQKQDSLTSTLQLAQDQQQIDLQMKQLQTEVHRQDQDIQVLQKQLKEADTILSTALFQAKQKLDQIQKAQSHQVSSEDLIRFAHRISSTNAVAAPASWVPGDPRRPYPTDIEMRMGLLARVQGGSSSSGGSGGGTGIGGLIGDSLSISQMLDSLHPPPPTSSSSAGSSSTPQQRDSTSSSASTPHHPHHQFFQQPWYSTSSSDLQQTLPSSNNLFPLNENVNRGGNSNSNHDDVEVMSTDSSSSSSSDSQ